MLPRTHEAIVRAAVARLGDGAGWTPADLPALLGGGRDEDDLVLLGLRFRAPGLTHTYRPGQRFGELFAPSAKTKMLKCLRRASTETTRVRAAWWVGRACHLLGDMAVPARTRGVWHLAGDPLEAWLEARAEQLGAMADHAAASLEATETRCRTPAELADALARASSAHAADTTRTPWGRLLYERARRGERLTQPEIEVQARALVPLVVASTAALLDAVPPSPRRAEREGAS
jgi:hypothetical protein